MSLTHSIPDVGALLGAAQDGVVQMAHVTFGPATTNDVVGAAVGNYTLLSVDQPCVITGMWTRVEEAFNGTVTVDIGDTSGASAFTSDTTIVSTSTGAVLIASTGLAVPYVKAADEDILVAIGDTVATTGILHVYVEYVVLND